MGVQISNTDMDEMGAGTGLGQGAPARPAPWVHACARAPAAPATFVFFSSRSRHTRCNRDWSSDVCSSDLGARTELSANRMKRESKTKTAITGKSQSFF